MWSAIKKKKRNSLGVAIYETTEQRIWRGRNFCTSFNACHPIITAIIRRKAKLIEISSEIDIILIMPTPATFFYNERLHIHIACHSVIPIHHVTRYDNNFGARKKYPPTRKLNKKHHIQKKQIELSKGISHAQNKKPFCSC